MTNIILSTLIFIIVLFIYLHIHFHLKTSNDIEIYDVNEITKEKLEEVLDIRQPVLFYSDNLNFINSINKSHILSNYTSFDIKIRNINEKDIEKDNEQDQLLNTYIPLSINISKNLFRDDKTASYISENNTDFIEESGILKQLKFNDSFFRPPLVSNCYYDIFFGSKNSYTPFRYSLNYRNFFILTEGSARIKLAPPNNIKYLYTEYDYEIFEFRSPINPWNPQPKYKADFNKVKCIEFDMVPNKILHIPAYWWYSIQFTNSETSITNLSYRTYMNTISILHHLSLHILQLQNITKKSIRKFEINEKPNQVNISSNINTIENSQNNNINDNDIIETTNIEDLQTNEVNREENKENNFEIHTSTNNKN